MQTLYMTIDGERVPVKWSRDTLPTTEEGKIIADEYRRQHPKPYKGIGPTKTGAALPSKSSTLTQDPGTGTYGAAATTKREKRAYMAGGGMGSAGPASVKDIKQLGEDIKGTIGGVLAKAPAPIQVIAGNALGSPLFNTANALKAKTKDEAIKVYRDSAAGTLAQPAQLPLEGAILGSPDATPLDRAGAAANIALNLLPVEEFVGGQIVKSGKYVLQSAREAKLAADLQLKLAEKGVTISKQEAKAAVQHAADSLHISGKIPETKPKTEPTKPKSPEFQSNTEGTKFTTERRPATKAEKKAPVQAPKSTDRYPGEASIKARIANAEAADRTPWMESQLVADKRYIAGQEAKLSGKSKPKVEVPKAEPPKPDMGFKSEPLPQPSKPREGATGLANQQQEREAINGIINDVQKTTGKGAKDWHDEGVKAFNALGEDDVTRMSEGKRIAQEIADGKAEFTPEKVGIATQTKRLLQQVRDAAEEVHLANPKDKAKRAAYEAATEDLDNFLTNVQSGKGRWSDVGRALQQGTTYNEGDFAQILQHVERKGSVSAKARKQLEDLSSKVAEKDKELADLKAKFAAGELVSKPRKYNREKIVKEIDDLWKKYETVQGSPSKVGRSKQSGAVSITAQDLKALGERAQILGQIVKKHIQLHAGAGLEDFVIAVQKSVRERLNIDLDRQAIIDLAAERGPARPKSEIQAKKAQLEAELRRETTLAKLTKEEKKALQEGKQAIRELDKKARESVRTQQALQAQESKLSKKNAQQVTAARTLDEEAVVKANADRRKRLEKLADLREQVQDLQAQLDTGNYRLPTKREKVYSQAEADLRAERDIYANKVRQAVRAAQTPRGEKVVRGLTGLLRGLKLGSDIGNTFRQGIVQLGELRAAGKSYQAAAKNVFSEKNFAKWERASQEKRIGGQLMEPIRKKAGLATTERGTLNSEEIGIGRWLSKIPGIGGAFDRWQHTFINEFRNQIFDASYISGLTEKELRQRAHFINNVTGRGNVKAKTPLLLESVMTSFKYESSRWGTIGEFIKNPATLIQDGKINRAALQNIKTMGQTAAGMYALAKAAELQGYVVDWSPRREDGKRNPDFLKMRKYEGGQVEWNGPLPNYVGGTPTEEVWDITAGLAPRVNDLFAVLFSFTDPSYGQSTLDVLRQAGGRTLSPGVTVPYEQGSFLVQRQKGVANEDLKSPLNGLVADDERKGWWAAAPLIATAFYQAGAGDGSKDFAYDDAIWAWIREFIGTGVNRYPKKD